MSADSTGRLLGGAGLALGLVGLYQADQADTRVRGLVADVASARAAVSAIPPPPVIPEIPPDRFRFRRIMVNASGAETCADEGESCVAVRSGLVDHQDGRFWGYAIPSCASRVRWRPGCLPGRNFEIDGTTFRRSPSSRVVGESGGPTCTEAPYYDFAVCLAVNPSDVRRP